VNIGIACYPTYGGSGVVATELGLKMAARGHQVHFITYAMPFRFDGYQPNVFFHEVEVPRYPLFEYPPYSLALASTLADTATRQELDILHCHYALPHAASAYLARQMIERALPIVTTLHGTDITIVGNDPSFLPITRFSIERSDAVTAVSSWLRDRTRIELGVEADIDVVPNFIDGAEFARVTRPDCSDAMAPGGEHVLVHVSNFRPVKRVHDVIEVFARVRAKVTARLLLIGDGPERPAAEQLCRELGVDDDVVFLGKQAVLPPLLSCACLFLLTSDAESFGLAALEAMACEVPVIGTDAGGLPEVVEQGVTGMLRPVGDVEGMAVDALHILGDRELHKKMALAARARALREFDPDRVVAQYEAIYRRVIERV